MPPLLGQNFTVDSRFLKGVLQILHRNAGGGCLEEWSLAHSVKVRSIGCAHDTLDLFAAQMRTCVWSRYLAGNENSQWSMWPHKAEILKHFQLAAEEYGVLPYVR
eukprot:4539735-Amphidinium_carterae.1